jgi:site-specific recombinase XerD
MTSPDGSMLYFFHKSLYCSSRADLLQTSNHKGGAAMNISTALKMFRDYQKSNLKPSTVIGYRHVIDNLEDLFGDKDLKWIRSEDIFHFLEIITENNSKATRRHRYSQLKAFFNFMIMNYEQDVANPLDSPVLLFDK